MAKKLSPEFKAFMERYQKSSFGERLDQMVFDPRLDSALAVVKNAVEAAYTPNALQDGGVVDALVMGVESPYQGAPMSAYDTALPIISNREEIATQRFALRCYILSGPHSDYIPLESMGQLDQVYIGLLPTFIGQIGEGILPMLGDVVKVRYHGNSLTEGEYLTSTGVNILDLLLQEEDLEAALMHASNQRKFAISAFDATSSFDEPCNESAPRSHPSTMKLSDEGLQEIRRSEGSKAWVYDDKNGQYIGSWIESEGYPTIGVGHLIKNDEKGFFASYLKTGNNAGMTEGEIMELFKVDAEKHVAPIRNLVTVPITQNQFDALASLVFNIGATQFSTSKVLRELNAGNCEAAVKGFMSWTRSGGAVMQGLVTRRKAEMRKFTT